MSECIHSEFQDQLPELAAGTIEYPVPVEGHVAACPHCTAELQILRAVRDAAVPVPHIHISKIVRALPPAPIPVREEAPWYRRASFQMAAAFLLVAGGLISVRQAGDRVAPSKDVSAVEAPAVQVAQSTVEVPAVDGSSSDARGIVAPSNSPAKSGIALVSGLDELSTKELTALLQDVDNLAAVPVDEPVEFSPVSAADAQGEG